VRQSTAKRVGTGHRAARHPSGRDRSESDPPGRHTGEAREPRAARALAVHGAPSPATAAPKIPDMWVANERVHATVHGVDVWPRSFWERGAVGCRSTR